MNLRNAAGIVLLAAAAGASYWWSRPPAAERVQQRTDSAELPGYYMRGAHFVATDEQGRVALRIDADSLAEVDGDLLALEGVRVEYTPAETPPWSFRADHGSAPKDRSQMDLEGNVVLRSNPADGHAPIEISTSTLQFVRAEAQVTTDRPVDLRWGRMQVNGVGLRAHLNANTLELESKVHGDFSR
ncbi:MAG TPA: LPS export ABC transporter periplasmic protein LptC [Gammaproteobacteria bacterium]|nr:LPS export ABC transporter periplasmic protein LptC [Gammaproteobacteria bacterium]